MGGAATTPGQLPVSAEDGTLGVGEMTSVIAPTVVSALAIPLEFRTTGGNSMRVAPEANCAGIVLVFG